MTSQTRMFTVMITCPVTHTPVTTFITIDQKSYDDALFDDGTIVCPHCQQLHVWRKADTYLEAITTH